MKITEKELIKIINEEIKDMIESDDIEEGVLDRLKAQGSGALAKVNPFADKGDAVLRQAASIMKSYGNHLLKLKQKLETDVQKLGIQDVEDIRGVLSTIDQTRNHVASVAKAAPRSEKFKAAVAAAVAKKGGEQPAAAEPAAAAAEPAAAPAAAEPAAAAPAAAPATPQVDNKLKAWVDGGKGELPARISHRSITNKARVTQKDGKTVFNSGPALALAQQFAQQFPQRTPEPLQRAIQDTIDSGAVGVAESSPISAEAHQQFLNEIDEWERQFEAKGKEPLRGDTLNEQLQKISERWGFNK